MPARSACNGLDLIDQSAEVKCIVSGAILLVAITIDTLSRRNREAAGRSSASFRRSRLGLPGASGTLVDAQP